MTKEKVMTGKKLMIGDVVKVRLMGSEVSERIWAKIMDVNVNKQKIRIELNNTPVNPEFQFGENLDVPVSYVLGKWEEYETPRFLV